eukprot:TRINITY_DN31221_c0_g1_i1.p1 TRINITY_DN31221_c0_g1~~TRINITY_DN31221_c0_g1_i1.p1  ORF type:complete len:489 (-),score=45.38 TRINITY_DN31221_c0_g1_i1:171-1571(-)
MAIFFCATLLADLSRRCGAAAANIMRSEVLDASDAGRLGTDESAWDELDMEMYAEDEDVPPGYQMLTVNQSRVAHGLTFNQSRIANDQSFWWGRRRRTRRRTRRRRTTTTVTTTSTTKTTTSTTKTTTTTTTTTSTTTSTTTTTTTSTCTTSTTTTTTTTPTTTTTTTTTTEVHYDEFNGMIDVRRQFMPIQRAACWCRTSPDNGQTFFERGVLPTNLNVNQLQSMTTFPMHGKHRAKFRYFLEGGSGFCYIKTNEDIKEIFFRIDGDFEPGHYQIGHSNTGNQWSIIQLGSDMLNSDAHMLLPAARYFGIAAGLESRIQYVEASANPTHYFLSTSTTTTDYSMNGPVHWQAQDGLCEYQEKDTSSYSLSCTEICRAVSSDYDCDGSWKVNDEAAVLHAADVSGAACNEIKEVKGAALAAWTGPYFDTGSHGKRTCYWNSGRSTVDCSGTRRCGETLICPCKKTSR